MKVLCILKTGQVAMPFDQDTLERLASVDARPSCCAVQESCIARNLLCIPKQAGNGLGSARPIPLYDSPLFLSSIQPFTNRSTTIAVATHVRRDGRRAMPVLDKEAAQSPESLFQGHFESQRRDCWRANRVAHGAETAVDRHRRSRGVAYSLRQDECRKWHQRRVVRSYLPLFPGYIIVLPTRFDRERSEGSKKIAQTLATTTKSESNENCATSTQSCRRASR